MRNAWGRMVDGLSILNACIAPHYLHARLLPPSRPCRPRIKTFPSSPRVTPKRSLRYGHGRRPSHMTREPTVASIRTVKRRRQTCLPLARLASAKGITCGARALSYLLRTGMVVARWRVSPGIQRYLLCCLSAFAEGRATMFLNMSPVMWGWGSVVHEALLGTMGCFS